MRVALVVDTAPPWSKGGRERRYAELLRRAHAELDVTVYTMRWWHGRPPDGAVAYVAICPLVLLYRGRRRTVLPGILFALGTLRLLVRRYDVIYADHMPYLHLFPLRLIAWLRRVPLVVEWHECWSPSYWREYLGRAGAVASAIERASLRLPDRIVADSAVLRGQLVAAGVPHARIVVVSNGVDRERLARALPAPDAPAMVVVGRLLEHKRIDLAVRALANLAGRAQVRLGIVGEGPERASLERLARELGVDGRVTFFGALASDDEVASLLRGASALLSTSEREGFGLIVAESLAVGTPVITVDCAENNARTLVDADVTGSIVACGNDAAVAAAAARWLDRDDRPAVRDAFWTAHPELEWDVSVREWVKVLRSPLARVEG